MVKFLFALMICCLTLALQAQDEPGKRRRFSPSDSTKSNYRADISLGNPTNKDVEMELDDAVVPGYRFSQKYSKPWFDFKKALNENTGIQLSINYTAVYMGATAKISPENQQSASGGIFDATIKWTFIGRNSKNKGSIIFWTDARHIYHGSVAPQFLNFETGSALLPALKFNKWTFRTLELYYQQTLFDRMDIVIGKIDMPDWFNFNGLLHPMLHFTDLAFSVSPTVSWSNPGFGIAAGGWVDKNKQLGIILGLNDVAGDNLASDDFFDMGSKQFFNGKFLKMAEVLYTPARAKYLFNRIGATFWHSDELLQSDESFFTSPSSKGFSVQATWVVKDKYIPVFTFGLSDGEGVNALSRLNISLAGARFFRKNHDMLGFGINYTSPVDDTLEGQFLSELFYRLTLSQAVAVTPTVKMVVNPSYNPDVSVLGYYGIRGRFSF